MKLWHVTAFHVATSRPNHFHGIAILDYVLKRVFFLTTLLMVEPSFLSEWPNTVRASLMKIHFLKLGLQILLINWHFSVFCSSLKLCIFDFAFPLVAIISWGQVNVDLRAEHQLSCRNLLVIHFWKYYTLFLILEYWVSLNPFYSSCC